MRTELFSSIGLYTPSFFRIHLGTNEVMGDIRQMHPDLAATFFHEYVHYLQDLTTTYGLMNINYVVDFIKTVNANQRNSGNRELLIPYQLSPENDGTVFYNSELQRIYCGTVTNTNARRINSCQIIQEQVTLLNAENQTYEKTVERVLLIGTDDKGQRYQYYFGSDAVIESMAYELEQHLYPGITDTPANFPYTACRLLANFLLPDFADDPLRVIAVCDVVMMEFNPGLGFYRAIEAIIRDKVDITDPDNIHKALYTGNSNPFLGFSTTEELFNYMSTSGASQLNSYFTTGVFGQNKIWFDYLFTKAAIIRRTHPNLFLQIARGGPIATNTAFHAIYGELGQPATTNNDFRAVYRIYNLDSNNIFPEMTWVINQIFNIYLNSGSSNMCRCNLYNWCRLSCEHLGIDDYTDDRCWDEPWARVNDAQPCTFAQVWKSWGMENEIPTPRP
ncbi:hypothetical protein [Sediminibacterium sp.]|jgi:hypothetical protein|uniref:hypothetical protein n=1 Tax=Sediminibacterium sp. TaxID=1917865 RepID=UPI0025CF34C3|nr:hypothetical protein [Sediminibacterium sp.]